MIKDDTKKYVGKRILAFLDRVIKLERDCPDDFTILECSPDGSFVKLKNCRDMEFWKRAEDISFVSELEEKEINKKSVQEEEENPLEQIQVLIDEFRKSNGNNPGLIIADFEIYNKLTEYCENHSNTINNERSFQYRKNLYIHGTIVVPALYCKGIILLDGYYNRSLKNIFGTGYDI